MGAKKQITATPEQYAEQLIPFIEDLKRQWMATIDALVDPLILIDSDYRIRKANLAMAMAAGTNIKNLIGQTCYQAFAKRSNPCPGCKMQQTYKTSTPTSFELEVGDQTSYEVTAQPIQNKNGKVEGVVHIYRDQTEAKQLREQLLQNEKLSSIGLLAGGVAHEINNPLGGILVFAQMLAKELPPESTHLQDVKEILHAAERCKEIVENLLDFARSNTHSDKAKNESFPVTEAVKAALRFGKIVVSQDKISIEEDWNDFNQYITGDRNKVIQLFLNLIQNAIQAMPEGGTLSLSSRTVSIDGKSYLKYEVSDTGIGISEKHKTKIFDPFFTTKEPGHGTGLGLAICYGIVKDLDGQISFSSKLNEGTTFTVLLPCTKISE